MASSWDPQSGRVDREAAVDPSWHGAKQILTFSRDGTAEILGFRAAITWTCGSERHTFLKWFIFPHLMHFLLYAGHFSLSQRLAAVPSSEIKCRMVVKWMTRKSDVGTSREWMWPYTHLHQQYEGSGNNYTQYLNYLMFDKLIIFCSGMICVWPQSSPSITKQQINNWIWKQY